MGSSAVIANSRLLPHKDFDPVRSALDYYVNYQLSVQSYRLIPRPFFPKWQIPLQAGTWIRVVRVLPDPIVRILSPECSNVDANQIRFMRSACIGSGMVG